MRGLSLAASGLVGLVDLGNIAEGAVSWFTYSTVSDYRAGIATNADLAALDQTISEFQSTPLSPLRTEPLPG